MSDQQAGYTISQIVAKNDAVWDAIWAARRAESEANLRKMAAFSEFLLDCVQKHCEIRR